MSSQSTVWMPYLGYIDESSFILISLSKESRKNWKTNRNIFLQSKELCILKQVSIENLEEFMNFDIRPFEQVPPICQTVKLEFEVPWNVFIDLFVQKFVGMSQCFSIDLANSYLFFLCG